MRKRLYITTSLLLILCLTSGLTLRQHDDDPAMVSYHFAFSLQPSTNTCWFTTAIVKVHEGKIIKVRHITPANFVLEASGVLESQANPQKVNLFSEKGIEGCLTAFNPIANEFEIACGPVTNIWKLRYNKHPDPPENMADKNGWSGMKYRPTDGQMSILRNYGIRHISHLTWGEDAFRLLSDMNNPAWIATYRGS